MSINQAFLAELDHEAANTRKILALISAEHADFKPHSKSFALGPLAVHVAELHRWIETVLRKSELNFASGEYKPEGFSTNEELLSRFDRYAAEGKGVLAATTDADFGEMWTLRSGGHVIFTMPRVVVLRSMVFNHIVHHRAQLTVYLRLLGISVPGMYGPSADE